MLVWGGRLAVHIAGRTRGAGDDPRYAEFEREWGADFKRRLFLFLQIQAVASWPLVGAVALAARSARPFPDALDLVGVIVAAVALAGEAVADAQLARFRRSSGRGAICEAGLWRYSRHPNYAFEALFWCAWPLIAFDPAWPPSLLALAAPLFMYGLAELRQRRAAAGEAHARLARRGVRRLCAARQPLLPGPAARLNRHRQRAHALGAEHADVALDLVRRPHHLVRIVGEFHRRPPVGLDDLADQRDRARVRRRRRPARSP